MKYGFVIDNRKCIGCHACTTACKSEHDVAVGVNRTWVKQVEKGEFPNTRRLFSVMRCNHCTDAPCVTICPVEALYTRKDGIVDFDKDRCIGCKSCMQACPYDALYIDPDTNTAAKCNYCAHRVDIGLEPACVNVCPEHAIISGDMEDPDSEISTLLSRQAVKTRKSEKGTLPNLFYIDADEVSIIPSASHQVEGNLWGGQARGVGHFAKEAEKMSFSNPDVLQAVSEINENYNSKEKPTKNLKSIDIVMNQAKEVYNTPDKGILWGWEVSTYVWTKAIAAGMILVPLFIWIFGWAKIESELWMVGAITAIVFLTLTGFLLIKDLDQPKRFTYVLLRPQWNSWLVKGGYSITLYGGLLTLILLCLTFNWTLILRPLLYISGALAVIVAVYTAFLFAQAKGRDFWQSPALALHMFIHSIIAGVFVYLIFSFFNSGWTWNDSLIKLGAISIILNLIVVLIELSTSHPTEDAHRVVKMIVKGRYSKLFWLGVVLLGNIIPLIIIYSGLGAWSLGIASVLALVGIYLSNHIWVEAPQRIPLS